MSRRTSASGRAADFLAGGGEMAKLIRRKDWSRTPLGPPANWPQSLRTTVSLCLASNFPINIIWGPEHTQIYNDGYRVVCGEVHPRALGEDYSLTWASAWPAIGESFERALAGEMMYLENQRMFLKRLNGALEETFFTFSHSPIRDETGGVGGLFHPVTETTATILSERRTRALRDLSASLGVAADAAEVARRTVEVLSRFEFDLPFLLFYTLDPNGSAYRLAGHHGIAPGKPAAPLRIEADAAGPWPFAEALAGSRIVETGDFPSILQGETCGPYDEPPDRAFVVPIVVPAAERPPAAIILGASPRLPLTEAYRSFYDLLSVTISGALGTVRAREDERRRAEALAEIDRAKTVFFSNVSHEFRTPLTLMLGPLEEALAGTGLAAEDRERLGVAHRNSLRLLKLVNSLLDFSRIEAGRVQASYEPTDLAALTAELASNFRSACDRAGLALEVDCPPFPEPAYVDREMWEKIVLNLVSNAFKYTFAGGIAVALRRDGSQLELSVRDTGIGVSKEELPRLFDRFHRIENAQGRTHEGTGIGLALVQELVKMHGGRVRVDSIHGAGSTFTVALPLGTAHLPQDRIRAPRALASTMVGAHPFVEEALRWLPHGSGDGTAEAAIERALLPDRELPAKADGERATVLLADDNADMRDYVRRLLGSRYEVQTVADGAAALAAVRQRRPDLLLSDVMMPRLDGFELVRAIRADPALADLPIILLSARAGEEASIEGLEAGADDYLIKPFSARELHARVRANLDLARLRREAAQALRQTQARLEGMVEERTRELQTEMAERQKVETALRQSQQLEAVAQLTGGVAHDFNNLLTVVIGQAESIIMAAEGNERIVRMATAAQRVAERGAQLTSQLLAFSRRQRLRPEAVIVGRVLAEIGDLVRRAVGETITVDIAADPLLWRSLVDSAQFEAAVLNLAVNARDAMPDGGNLTIEAGNRTVTAADAGGLNVGPGEYVRVAVCDTGHGMTPEVLRRSFEPFFTTKDVGKGTGLGLSQIYGFARQSGGTATADSVPGRGTTIALYLPRAMAEAAAESAPQPRPAPSSGQDRTILIVEDQEEVREVIEASLAELGFRTLSAPDGIAARRILESGQPIDLLLTDIVMPNGVGGVELAQWARRVRQDLKILLISGYARRNQAQPAPDGFPVLEKPFRQAELADAVAVALGDAAAADPARSFLRQPIA